MVGETEQKFYDDALATGGESWESVGYAVKASQTERFETLLQCLRRGTPGLLSGQYRLLDVGCGVGDLYAWLLGRSMKPLEYVGIDVQSEMIERCRRRMERGELPGSPKFYGGDLFDLYRDEAGTVGPGKVTDVVCAISTFAFKHPEDEMGASLRRMQSYIAKMTELARDLVFVTLFSPWAARLEPLGEALYVDPMAMWSWAKQQYGRVDLFHSYAPHDFALAIWLDEGRWWREWREKGR